MFNVYEVCVVEFEYVDAVFCDVYSKMGPDWSCEDMTNAEEEFHTRIGVYAPDTSIESDVYMPDMPVVQKESNLAELSADVKGFIKDSYDEVYDKFGKVPSYGLIRKPLALIGAVACVPLLATMAGIAAISMPFTREKK